MRTLRLRLLLLFAILGVFALQALASQHHVHELREEPGCAACILHASPAQEPDAVVEALPPPDAPRHHATATLPVAPPPALEPGDVSFATSPPTV